MKKFISLILAIIMVFSVVSLVGCGSSDSKNESEKENTESTPEIKEEALKLGLGAVGYVDNTKSADGDQNGMSDFVSTVVAVLLDKDGKIVKCSIDALDATLSYTSKGEFVAIDNFASKKELGNDYGMVKSGVSKKEWFEQVEAFEALVVGKTRYEVEALVAGDDGKGTSDVINAGCTIAISDFANALGHAVSNAKDSNATSSDKLSIGLVAKQTGTNATHDKIGSNEVEVTAVAIATDKDGKATASFTDAFTGKVSYSADGKPTLYGKEFITTKLRLGKEYGMVASGVSKLEWFEQAAAFDKTVIGKTADEITKLEVSGGKGSPDVVNAGCTIVVSDLVKAAQKAAK